MNPFVALETSQVNTLNGTSHDRGSEATNRFRWTEYVTSQARPRAPVGVT